MKSSLFIVSFHDLSLHSQYVCCDVIETMKAIGIPRLSLLVTPYWHSEKWIDQAPDFLPWLKACEDQGHEVSLHGLTHQVGSVQGGMISQWIGRIYTQKEGEFYQISRQEANSKVPKGLNILRSVCTNVQGFTPPAWLLSREGRSVLKEHGIVYCTRLQQIDFLQLEQQVYAPTLVFSSRSAWRRWASIRWVKTWKWIHRNTPVIRLAIHPLDWNYPTIRKTICALAQELIRSRQPTTYLELTQHYMANNAKATSTDYQSQRWK